MYFENEELNNSYQEGTVIYLTKREITYYN